MLPVPFDLNPDDPLFRTYRELSSLAAHGALSEDGSDNAVSIEDAPAFLGKLTQYYVFCSIDSLERDSVSVCLGCPDQAKAGIAVPNAEPYPYDKLSRQLAYNMFFRTVKKMPSYEQIKWKGNPVNLPTKTEPSFFELHDPERYVLRFQRPNYFTVDFIADRPRMGTGIGKTPPHFVTARKSTTMLWPLFVTMQYQIEHPCDSAFNPTSYSQWLDAVYSGLHGRMAAE
jgi:hypothetical protein